MFLAIAVSGSALAIELDVSGACPGRMALTLTGEAGASFALVAGEAAGSRVLDRGPCAGTDIGLTGSPLMVFSMPSLPGDGTRILEPTVPEAACSRHIVAVDLDRCVVSPAVGLDDGGCDPALPSCGPATTAPTSHPRDFAYSYWPENHFPD